MGKTRIRALVLDYGGVISKPQNPDSVNNMLQILKQDDNDFRSVYRSRRDNYDNGQLSGEEYWHSILQHYGLEHNNSKVTKLIQEDIFSFESTLQASEACCPHRIGRTTALSGTMDLSCRGWPWETLIRSRHRADRFDARQNKNYPEWRDDEHLQARRQD